jgi:UDP-N-acetylmuramate--alanine ligase
VSIFNSDLRLGEITRILKDVKGSVRFIGILGSGMYPLARLLLGRGYLISGYDRDITCAKADVISGMVICAHTEIDLTTVSLAVYSLAIDECDPEIEAIRKLGIPLISRAQLLGALMSEAKTSISVSGSHGKSTTTAIIDRILTAAGKRHTAVSGAELSSGESFFDGGGDIFLAEACEYKDSFLRLSPTHQVITSVELDHTDYFASLDDIRASFLAAAERAQITVINRDDEVSATIIDELIARGKKPITYGKDLTADYRLWDIERAGELTSFTVSYADRTVRLSTSLIGEYNLYNITAAVAVAHTLGIENEAIIDAVSTFRPIDRRLSHIADFRGVPILYDYAHHPTEINAVITALKERFGSVTVIFRPHTYSRTASLWQDFISALCKADFTILLDIYPARERAINGITSQNLAKCIPGSVFSKASDAAKIALSHPSRVIALLGAGEVERVKEDLVALSEKHG